MVKLDMRDVRLQTTGRLFNLRYRRQSFTQDKTGQQQGRL